MSVVTSMSAERGSAHSMTPGLAPPAGRQVLNGAIALAALLMFVGAGFRHYVLRSGAFDLGFFDQAVWLISQGQTPISSLRDFHVLADHASVILYPLALFYVVLPDPHTLLAVQSIVLALGAWPVHRLALGAGLSERQSLAIAAAYLMYPFVLTANLFDFHPETIAMPAILMAILAARENKRISFCIWIAIVLACKEVMGLTVAMMGIWLLFSERKRFHGTVALVAGTVWFIFALKFIVPYFGDGRQPSGMNYYGYLGTSLEGIIKTILTQPYKVLSRVFSLDGIKYMVILVAPAIWGLHYRTLAPLIVCLPVIGLNLLSTNPMLRSPFYQYSLPMVPFFFLAIILAVSTDRAWLTRPRYIVGWALMLLVAGGVLRLSRMQTGESSAWDQLRHTREAIDHVPAEGALLTTFEVFPHVSRRTLVHYVGGHDVSDHLPLHEYSAILFNVDHRSMSDYASWVDGTIATLKVNPEYKVAYEQPDVVLFVKAHEEPLAPDQTARSDEGN